MSTAKAPAAPSGRICEKSIYDIIFYFNFTSADNSFHMFKIINNINCSKKCGISILP